MSDTPKPRGTSRKIREVREIRLIRSALNLGMPEDRAFVAVYDSLPVGNRGEWIRRRLLAGHSLLTLQSEALASRGEALGITGSSEGVARWGLQFRQTLNLPSWSGVGMDMPAVELLREVAPVAAKSLPIQPFSFA